MNRGIAKLIRGYATIMTKAQPDFQHATCKWLKRYWKALPAKERFKFRHHMEMGRGIPIAYRVRSYDKVLTMVWDIPAKKIDRRKHGRSISSKRYYPKKVKKNDSRSKK